MSKSVNINDVTNTIKNSEDSFLYKKTNGEWTKIKNNVHKIFDKEPSSSLGNEGDYCFQFLSQSNYIKNSENFKEWFNTNLDIDTDEEIIFPYSQSTVISNTLNKAHHNIIDVIDTHMEKGQKKSLCFSIYVKPQETKSFYLGLYSKVNKSFVKANFTITSSNGYVQLNKSCKVSFKGDNQYSKYSYDISQAENNSYRAYVSIEIDDDFSDISAIFGLLNEYYTYDSSWSYSKTDFYDDKYDSFIPPYDNYGLFINSAQINEGLTPSKYVYSDGFYGYSNILNNIYQKQDSFWVKLNNKVIFSSKINNMIGNDDDLLCLSDVITLESPVKFGYNSDDKKIESVLFWDKALETYSYYVGNTKYYLMKSGNNISTDYQMFNDAINFSTQILNQTWCPKYTQPSYSHTFGLNSCGHNNVWSYDSMRKYY